MAIIAISIYSCSDSDNYDLEIENKRTTLANKSSEIYIREFIELPVPEKYIYFSNKIDQVIIELEQNGKGELTSELAEIKNTYQETENDSTKFEDLKLQLIKISEIIPDEDFIAIFNSMKNYKFNGFKGEITGKIKDFLISEPLNPYNSNNNTEKDKNLPDCNCNWACDHLATQVPGGTSEKGCNPTDSGCGPFGTSGCYRVIKSHGTVVDL